MEITLKDTKWIGECDYCAQVRYLQEGIDAFGVHVLNYCAFGCKDKRSIPLEPSAKKRERTKIMSFEQFLNVKEFAEVGASIQFEKDGQIFDLAVEEVCGNYVVVTNGIKVPHPDYLITAYDLQERETRDLAKTNLLKSR